MTDKLYAEYGNAGHKFPRSTKEAFGRNEPVYLANEYDVEIKEFIGFSFSFATAVYVLAVVVVVALW